MSKSVKRKAENDENVPVKKSKKENQLSEDRRPSRSSPEEQIHDVRGLSLLLASTQLGADELNQRLLKLKSFLGSIAFSKSEDSSSKIFILVKYLQSQISTEDEARSRSVPDIIKIAHHAGQINSENLISSVTTVISLLLKAISDLHELREIGNSLCRMLLHDDHIQLIGWGMSAAKHKEHLISPCLRLLREIVLFDGGRVARAVYRQRHITFQRLEVFLTMRGAKNDDDHKTRKRPSVRSNAISYLLANLRLQGQTAKCYILGRNKWMRALLSDIGNDPPGLVHGILDTLRKDVAEDKELPLIVKGRFFDDWALHQLVTLYGFKQDAPEDGKPGIRDLAHALLETIFVSADHSLILALESQHPRESLEKNGSDSDEESTSHGSADIRKIRRNLISFIKHLRPYASNPQTDLLLSCFQISPQLLQDYFTDKLVFSFDPKLTATWIGYSQFILGIIQQPWPEGLIRKCFKQEGQSIDLLLDHILPPPLTQKVLTKCFNQNSTLIKFFASRILVAAFEKMFVARDTLISFQQAISRAENTSQGSPSTRLFDSFSQRLPRFKDVASQFRGCQESAIMLRESLLRLLVHYYRELPQLALADNLDISTSLSTSLAASSAMKLEEKKDGISSLILDHLMQIAIRSMSIQWWHKSDSTPLTTFSCLLKAYVEGVQDSNEAKKLLESLMEQNYLTFRAGTITGSKLFIHTLKNKAIVNRDALYVFLDNCFVRCVKKTVVYSDLLDELVKIVEDKGEQILPGGHPDLLMVTLMEQLPYLVARQDEEIVAIVAGFLRTYLEFLRLKGVNRPLLILIRDTMQVCFERHGKCLQLFGKALQEPLDIDLQHSFDQLLLSNSERNEPVATPLVSTTKEAQLEVDVLPGPPIEDEDHPGLTRWTREDLQDAIDEGAVAELILCLCSEFEEIRKGALIGIGKLMQKLEFSGYSEWRQVRLLIGELRETANNVESENALPYVAGVFATHLLQVVIDPLHFLYKKVNNFLNKGPQWTVAKLPSYWTDKILLRPPTNDESHYQEIEWLLDVLTDGLRTPKDMDIYRQSQVMEKILTLAASPQIRTTCYEKIIDLLFRCTYVEGSTILITRCGLMSWLAIHAARKDGRLRSKLVVLGRRAYETCDQSRVNEWSGESLSAALEELDQLRVSANDQS